MKDAKNQGHALYSVTRREQFVEDVQSSLKRSFDKQDSLFKAASRGDAKQFIRIVGRPSIREKKAQKNKAFQTQSISDVKSIY